MSRALTIRQPWASAIVYAGKDIENRSWRTAWRGRLWIHAAKTHPDRQARKAYDALDAAQRSHWYMKEPTGAIIGFVELVDIIRDSDSEWAEPGMYHWVLREPWFLDGPIQMRGYQGLWRPEIETGILRAYAYPQKRWASSKSRDTKEDNDE